MYQDSVHVKFQVISSLFGMRNIDRKEFSIQLKQDITICTYVCGKVARGMYLAPW
jgi:hypothetical protein